MKNTTQLQEPTNKKQMAKEMGISPATLRRRLKSVGIEVPRGLISPKQRDEILHCLGWHEVM